MCGFTGFWGFNANLSQEKLQSLARQMAFEIQERGPDDKGEWADAHQGLAFGYRRLAILDLSSAGHQPMESACGRYVIVYNGEIYNYQDIQRQLLAERSLVFKGTSDTEVLLEACALWGVPKTVSKCIGMFAFALWDKQEKKLTLARDRLGIKPLYWGWQGQTFFFGSQLKSFRPHPAWNPKISSDILAAYVRFGYVGGTDSIYENIYHLSPGHILVIDSAKKVSTERYWFLEDFVSLPKRAEPSEVLLEELEPLLKDAVQKRLLADVPLGAFLSGGIDSSLVVALMQGNASQPVKTFSIGFEEKEYDEAAYAKAMAKHLGTDHTELYLPVHSAAEIIPLLPDLYDEPFADSSQIPTYLVSKLARQHVTVSLSGDGGDELFAGYNRYYYMKNISRLFLKIPPFVRQGLSKGIELLSEEKWTNLAHFIPSAFRPRFVGQKAHKLAHILKAVSEEEIYKILVSQAYCPQKYVTSSLQKNPWQGLLDQSAFHSFIEYMQYVDTKTYLPGDILTKVDRASMGISLEARVPLLDHRVVEFAARLPLSFKIRDGKTKWPLRQILNKYVPESLYDRPKTGFGIPIHAWLRGSLRGWGEALLSESSLKMSSLLNVKEIRSLWQGYQTGNNEEVYALWTLLMFQAWYIKYHG